MEASLADSHSAADFEMKVVHQVAEGSWVATHWEMEGVHHSRPTRDPIHKHMEPSGKQVRVAGITLRRVQNGKIA
jgi:hypothetical protein